MKVISGLGKGYYVLKWKLSKNDMEPCFTSLSTTSSSAWKDMEHKEICVGQWRDTLMCPFKHYQTGLMKGARLTVWPSPEPPRELGLSITLIWLPDPHVWKTQDLPPSLGQVPGWSSWFSSSLGIWTTGNEPLSTGMGEDPALWPLYSYLFL